MDCMEATAGMLERQMDLDPPGPRCAVHLNSKAAGQQTAQQRRSALKGAVNTRRVGKALAPTQPKKLRCAARAPNNVKLRLV
eukprot:1898135-Alexandrium_andersonii.AAC.1